MARRQLKCIELGGHLAVVKSEEENWFLTAVITEQRLDTAWLGATDERVEQKWVWVDGTPMRYSNWDVRGKQPNNKGGLEHYMVIRADAGGFWSDQPDWSIQHSPGFICQWD